MHAYTHTGLGLSHEHEAVPTQVEGFTGRVPYQCPDDMLSECLRWSLSLSLSLSLTFSLSLSLTLTLSIYISLSIYIFPYIYI